MNISTHINATNIAIFANKIALSSVYCFATWVFTELFNKSLSIFFGLQRGGNYE